MYANNNPWSSPMPSDSSLPANNPFLENSAANRFPAIDSSQGSFQSPSLYPSQSPSSAPSQFQQQPQGASQPYMGWNGQPQQSPTYGQSTFLGYGTTQLQSAAYATFGPQGSLSGGLSQQPLYTGYPQNQQSSISLQQYQQHQQSVVNQFDPYGMPGNSQNQPPGGQGASAQQSNSQSVGPSGNPHPRQYIKTHKMELESWDAAIWKQALLIFEELKRSWETRRAEIQKQLLGGHYLTAEEVAYLNGLTRTAESNIDSVVASLIQMQEAHSGYKQSLDATSKMRVREALNAGLQGLPEWP